MVIIKGNFWVDKKGNRWSLDISEQEANDASKSLTFCTGCTDCFSCDNCHGCTDCIKCKNLIEESNQSEKEEPLPISDTNDYYLPRN